MPCNENGYWTNSLGHLVHQDQMHGLDILRDDTVSRIIHQAHQVQDQMRQFKTQALDDIISFCHISAEQYNWQWGGKKGNLQLMSFDAKYKVQLAVSDTLDFDERIHVAKGLIDECITEWAENSRSEIKTLIDHAFQVDKLGKINTGRIFGLMRVKIGHHKWLQAMDALKDSIQITATSQYLRLYERQGNTGKYKQIPMDIAGLKDDRTQEGKKWPKKP